MAGLPPADGRRRSNARERLGHLRPLRGSRRQAAACRARRPVPHAADPARRGRAAAAAQLLAVRSARRRLLPDRRQARADGAASGYLHTRLAVGDQLDVAAPRGTFMLDDSDAPVLLISAGIGSTPVLAMLNALAEQHSEREIWWLHGARSSREHSFAAETRALLGNVPERAHARLLQPARRATTSKVATSTHRPSQRRRCCSNSSRRATRRPTSAARRASWTRSAPRLASIGVDAVAHPHRAVRARTPASTPGIARDARPHAAPARRRTGRRPDDRVRAQQPRRPVEQRLRQPARARRGLRRARPLVLPHRRLPNLRDDADRRRPRLQPRPGRAAADGSALICCSQPRDDSCSICEPTAHEARRRSAAQSVTRSNNGGQHEQHRQEMVVAHFIVVGGRRALPPLLHRRARRQDGHRRRGRRRGDVRRARQQLGHHQRRRRSDRRQADRHARDAAGPRSGQQLPQHPRRRHPSRVRASGARAAPNS